MDDTFELFDPWAVKSEASTDFNLGGFGYSDGFSGYEDMGLVQPSFGVPFSFTTPTPTASAAPTPSSAGAVGASDQGLWMVNGGGARSAEHMDVSAPGSGGGGGGGDMSLVGGMSSSFDAGSLPLPSASASNHSPEETLSPEPVSFPFLSFAGEGDGFVNTQLDTLASQLDEQNRVFSTLRSLMVKLVKEPSPPFFDKVNGYMVMATDTLEDQNRQIEKIYEEHVLSYETLLKWRSLRKVVDHQQKQLKLLKFELTQLSDMGDPENSTGLASLYLVEETSADVLFKGKAPVTPFSISLMTASSVQLEVVGPLTATVVCDTQLWKNKFSRKPFNEQPSDGIDVDTPVNFSPKFQVGTRKSCITLRFSVPVMISSPTSAVVSTVLEVESRSPLIVITNECQWVQAQKQLLVKEIFGTSLEVSWPHFANKLMIQWLKMTRQPIDAPERVLSVHDMEYIHEKLFHSKASINMAMMDAFWSWLGKGMHILRYHKSVGNMWKRGLLYGLMSKDECTAAVRENRAGTFIVRLSERHSGSFAVAYKHLDQVKHYLIRSSEFGGRKRSLADFLWDCPQFVYILKLCVNKDDNGVHLMCVRKDKVLGSFITPQQSLAIEGYEDLPSSGPTSVG